MSEPVVRLMITDLDGTLLNSDHVVAPFTDQAIREAQARGVLFTVATGKTFPSTHHLIRQFDIRIPLVCGNGTQIFMPDGALLREDPIPLEFAVEAVRLAEAEGFTTVAYTLRGLLASVWDANIDELVAHHEPKPEIVPDMAVAFKTHKPYKLILMSQDYEAVNSFQDILTRALGDRAQVLRSGLGSVVEVLPLGVTKGTALAFILGYLGITPSETIAFGDNCNDVEMLQRAGIGVAMGHAPEDVRRHADYVTGTNDEDGVGHAIHRFVLSPNGVTAAHPKGL